MNQIGILVADATGTGFELLEKLESDAELGAIASAKAGLKDMRLLFEYLEVYGCLDKVSYILRTAI